VTSFRIRIVLWYTAVAMVTLVVFRFATVQVIQQSLYDELDASLVGEMDWIKGMLRQNKARNLPDEEIRDEILVRSRLSPRKEFIEIYDLEGQEYFRSPNLEETDTLRTLVSIPAPDSVLTHSFRNHQLRLIASGDEDVEIYVGYPLTDVHAAVDEIISSFLFLIPGAAVLFIIGGMFLGTRFLKPIKDLRVYAEKMADQPLDREIPEVSARVRDEVGLLINQINQMVHRMRSSMRQVLSFSTLASHELKTPLTVMRNELEEALRDDVSKESLQAALVSTYDEILRLTRVVDDLLSLGTMRAGTFRLQQAPADLNDLLTEFCDEAALLCQPKEITLSRSLVPGLKADLDHDRFRTVLFNLLDNAIRHTPEGGTISFTSFRDGDRIVIECSDTGPGVREPDIPYIFDPFRRVTDEATRPGGAGLGLSLVRWIVEAHNGTIHVSKKPGGRTAFVISLPPLHATVAR